YKILYIQYFDTSSPQLFALQTTELSCSSNTPFYRVGSLIHVSKHGCAQIDIPLVSGCHTTPQWIVAA
ncbi:hypothetical protein CVT25_006191, partial [Psilocybe cyanescens]